MKSLVILSLFAAISSALASEMAAVCRVQRNSAASGLADDVSGTVRFYQQDADSDVEIEIDLSGFGTSDAHTLHGFHIHTDPVSDGANNCSTAGGHYNPDNHLHGAPSDHYSNRHTGDLGNIEEDSDGAVMRDMTDSYISLQGDYNIIGRAVVIHQSEDTLDESVDASGGAGARIACCTIEETEANSTATASLSMLSFGLLAVLKLLM